MSQDLNTPPENDTVNLPDPSDIGDGGYSETQRKPKISTGTKLILGGGSLVLLVIAAMTWSVTNEMAASHAQRVPSLDSTPGGEVQANNPRYQGYVEQSNDDRSTRATELGVTFVPTPEGILEPIVTREADAVVAVEPEPVVVREATPVIRETSVIPAPQRTAVVVPSDRTSGKANATGNGADQKPKNPFTAAMMKQMGSVSSAYQARPSSLTGSATSDETALASDGSGLSGTGTGTAVADPTPVMILLPGDILYGETITSVNSDATSPVLVELTTGEYKGARLIGAFTVDASSNRLIVSFSQMTFLDGRTTGINAFAVDGKSAETAVASDVDRRYVARYGPIFASTFISAFAKAASTPAETMTGTGENATVVQDQPTGEQAAYAGLGAATDIISQDIMANVPKGPKITLRDGYPLAILFIDPVSVENSI